mmetsp:Transcript_30612/g.90912  ORF Transcript_30612/g.90912 Transcript_30612/m.90912 type:complete len:279 (+) Transcript_30612:591-1427(+)
MAPWSTFSPRTADTVGRESLAKRPAVPLNQVSGFSPSSKPAGPAEGAAMPPSAGAVACRFRRATDRGRSQPHATRTSATIRLRAICWKASERCHETMGLPLKTASRSGSGQSRLACSSGRPPLFSFPSWTRMSGFPNRTAASYSMAHALEAKYPRERKRSTTSDAAISSARWPNSCLRGTIWFSASGTHVGGYAEWGVQVVHVEEDAHRGRQRGQPPLDQVHLVLPAQPRVREKQVVLSAGIAVREVERHAAAAPEELLPAALQPEIGDKQRHAAGEE